MKISLLCLIGNPSMVLQWESDIPLLPCLNSQFAMRKGQFVGGVSDGYYGTAMMDTATHNLTGKRTWHFYDDIIVALANDIQDNSTALLQTTMVMSRLLPPANTPAGTTDYSME